MEAIIAAHVAHLARMARQPGSIYQRQRALARLAREISPTPILDVTLDQLRNHTARASTHESATANEVSHLRAFFKWAMLEELTDRDPTVRLERPRVPDGRPRPMPNNKVAWAMQHAPPHPSRIRPLLILAAYGGLRACEAARVHGGDVGAVNDGWLLVPLEKGGTTGEVRLTPPLERLAATMPAHDWWFPRQDRAGPIDGGYVSRITNRWLHAHEIPQTYHQLRHWFGTNVRRQGDVLVAQRALRHRRLASTQIYTEIEDDEVARVADGLEDFTAA